MRPMTSGILQRILRDLAPEWLDARDPYEVCLRFVLSDPRVHIALVGGAGRMRWIEMCTSSRASHRHSICPQCRCVPLGFIRKQTGASVTGRRPVNDQHFNDQHLKGESAQMTTATMEQSPTASPASALAAAISGPRTGIIDGDVHPGPRSNDEIRAHMPQPFRDRWNGGGRGFFGNPMHGARLDSRPPTGGGPGTDPDFLRQQLLDEYGIAHAILLPRAFCNLHPDPDFGMTLNYDRRYQSADHFLGYRRKQSRLLERLGRIGKLRARGFASSPQRARIHKKHRSIHLDACLNH